MRQHNCTELPSKALRCRHAITSRAFEEKAERGAQSQCDGRRLSHFLVRDYASPKATDKRAMIAQNLAAPGHRDAGEPSPPLSRL